VSYSREHTRMGPVLELARRLDIAANPDPEAIFEAGSAGFQVWCTPDDHPEGWGGIAMDAGAFSKPCEFVGGVFWAWRGEQVIGLRVETTAYALADQRPEAYTGMRLRPGDPRRSITNRTEDLEWLKAKVRWLFEQAGVTLPGDFFSDPVPQQASFDGSLEATYEERTDLADC